MRIVRSKVPVHTSYMYSKQVSSITRIWAVDVWCYIPELKVRQKFVIIPNTKEVEFFSEDWSGTVPKAINVEHMKYYKHSSTIWEEVGFFGIDRYSHLT